MVGLGAVIDGEIIDRDFFLGQFTFSDTTSNVKDGSLKFAMFDVGWSYSPTGGVKLGFFVGYHYWYEKVTAYGLVCNQASILGCTFPGEVQVGFDTAVLAYQPTWHAARIGFIGQIAITERLSFSARSPAFRMRRFRTRTATCCGRALRTLARRRTSSPTAGMRSAARPS